MKKLFKALLAIGASAFLSTASLAQTVTTPLQSTLNWSVYRGTSDQSSIGTAALVQWNATNFDPSSVCDTSSTWVCTPTVAGTYYVTCAIYVGSTTGATSTNNLADVQLVKNGTIFAEQIQAAQTGSVASALAAATVSSLVQLNGSSDTVGCKAQSNSTGPFVKGQQNRSFMTGYRVGP